MSKYICELCKKNFKQKSDYDKHKNNKKPCISIMEIEKMTQAKEVKNDNNISLTALFKYCLNVLRDEEQLIGDKALRNLGYLLILKLLENQTIDFESFTYDFTDVQDDMIDLHKKKLLELVIFDNLAKEKEDNLPNNIKCLWDDILSEHTKTKNIFLKNKGFDITKQSTYKKLITKLNSFNFKSYEIDILGEAYEEVIKDVMTGKTYGQFFTPPKIKKLMVDLVNPQVNNDGSIETIFDPAMGTGGFLITCSRHLINQSKTKNIKLDWDFIRTKGLGGREAEPDTYQLAVSNMLISTGHVFEVLEQGDSIRDPITNEYDIILANPPFGINGLIFDNIDHPLRNEYLPIKSNSAVPLFLQSIVNMLKIGGRCSIVLPAGQELFSKSNSLVAIREFLMKTCDLKEVVYFPAGTFTHTSIKTCIFYFIKKRQGKDVLETNIKISKITQKETEREYKFSKTHQTTKVHFYDCNPENGIKYELIEGGINIDEISKNNYSLNYAEYLKDNAEAEVYEKNIIVKTLSELCTFKSGKQLSKSNFKTGGYPVIGGGQQPSGLHNEFNKDKNTILCSSSGAYAGFISKYKSEVWASDCFSIHSKDEKVLDENYLYYYLKNIQVGIYKLQTGTAQPHIYPKSVENLKIPIPSLENQKKIIEYLDFVYEKSIKTSDDKINQLKKLNEYCLNNQQTVGENEMKTLKEVSFINPENMKSGQFDEINYIDISLVNKGILSGVKNLKTDFPASAKRIIKKEDILYSTVRPNLRGYTFIDNDIFNGIASTGFAQIRVNKDVLPKYVYFMLTTEYIIDILIKKSKGALYPVVSPRDFENLKIPIPSLEKQKEIVEYCESNDNLISKLKNEIEQNKIQATLFLSNILKVKIQDTTI